MPLDPLLLSTAIEIALRAGEMQMASFGRDDLRVDKKGRIDLVTEIDVAVERMVRDSLREVSTWARRAVDDVSELLENAAKKAEGALRGEAQKRPAKKVTKKRAAAKRKTSSGVKKKAKKAPPDSSSGV